MKHESMKLTSSYNNQLYIKVMNGHFATNHSHINQYIDMTTGLSDMTGDMNRLAK